MTTDEPPKRPPRVVVPCRFSPLALPAIARTAKALGIDRSTLIRRAVFEYVSTHDPERKPH